LTVFNTIPIGVWTSVKLLQSGLFRTFIISVINPVTIGIFSTKSKFDSCSVLPVRSKVVAKGVLVHGLQADGEVVDDPEVKSGSTIGGSSNLNPNSGITTTHTQERIYQCVTRPETVQGGSIERVVELIIVE